ncbi:hypothetical protein CAPTEDRAFT_225063 [Capitella teleta]|uniref:Sulfotransferase domain-containing protein n=1 Tax=Capitella teleta TaxID=283909 RepID=R7TND1_CAPTE|nr:hypothetical protein CAPTEDRAFT_225063 [Capitella teleta]|eukprot:ELT95052.1 hypothetical protein CAPTEDRAFT_225063 [Capitella teleta]
MTLYLMAELRCKVLLFAAMATGLLVFSTLKNINYSDDKRIADSPLSLKKLCQRQTFTEDVYVDEHRPCFVFYNRVPKCGSRGLLYNARILSHRNHFTWISSKQYRDERLNHSKISLPRKLSRYNTKAVFYDKHVHYINFTRLHLPQPAYINLIRDPVDRMISWYYFIRFEKGHIRSMTDSERNMSFDDCVRSSHPDCVHPFNYSVLVPYFCGLDEFCRYPGPKSLAQAKANLKQHYTIVGLADQMEDFYWALERLLPDYFRGILDLYRRNESKMRAEYKTNAKGTCSNETRSLLKRNILIEEYDLYHFARKMFAELRNKMLKT